jgi:hypothetical protein
VRSFEVGREGEAHALLAIARAEHGSVDGEAESARAGGFCAVHEIARDPAIALKIDLHP